MKEQIKNFLFSRPFFFLGGGGERKQNVIILPSKSRGRVNETLFFPDHVKEKIFKNIFIFFHNRLFGGRENEKLFNFTTSFGGRENET